MKTFITSTYGWWNKTSSNVLCTMRRDHKKSQDLSILKLKLHYADADML
jgi:hypothetical protein